LELQQVAYTILLVLPGFLCVKSFNWSARPRHVTDVELTLWSILLGVVALVLFRFLVNLHWQQADLDTILENPVKASAGLRVAVLVGAPVGGWLVGKLDRQPWFEHSLRKLGYDLRHSLDLWQVELGSHRYVTVWLKDGTILYGWPLDYSTDRRDTAELNLNRVRKWDANSQQFVANPDQDATVLIERADISYIESPSIGYPPLSVFRRIGIWWHRLWFQFP
jgi:hypothetical protein